MGEEKDTVSVVITAVLYVNHVLHKILHPQCQPHSYSKPWPWPGLHASGHMASQVVSVSIQSAWLKVSFIQANTITQAGTHFKYIYTFACITTTNASKCVVVLVEERTQLLKSRYIGVHYLPAFDTAVASKGFFASVLIRNPPFKSQHYQHDLLQA